MKKRTYTLFILAAIILGPLYPAQAQRRAALPRIGVLQGGVPPNANIDVFIQELRELGYVEGKDIQVELPELTYQWNENKGQWHFSDVLSTGVTGKTAGDRSQSDSLIPHAQLTPTGDDELENKSGASLQQRWLLIFPPAAPLGTGDSRRYSGWAPAQIFESEQSCNHYKAALIADVFRLSDRRSSINWQLLESNCIPASEFISGKDADIIVVTTLFEPVAAGFSSHLLYGKVFNRGQATARNVVMKYQIRDSNGLNVMQGDVPIASDIPPLTFAEFRTPSFGGRSLHGLSVKADAAWQKK